LSVLERAVPPPSPAPEIEYGGIINWGRERKAKAKAKAETKANDKGRTWLRFTVGGEI
jgi:hypothetical protein